MLEAEGVAVLPRYLVDGDLRKARLRVVLPRAPLASDTFRLFYWSASPRRAVYESIASTLKALPLR